MLFSTEIIFLWAPDIAIMCLNAMILTLMEYQRVWAVARPCVGRITTEPVNTKPGFKTWGCCVLGAPSYWEMGYILGG